ncbi:hypothetical protein EMPS_10218 [Entomortierella parvispora]|uniref:D-arabinono-1,4-lactone oxidase n=1 Tax=Entomortierella parvispora TaxID=205924 RepID=A0A9P3M106_9FUNG|nr:hypothetical protein EMPS_10218 [Entomortierella parvispora]
MRLRPYRHKLALCAVLALGLHSHGITASSPPRLSAQSKSQTSSNKAPSLQKGHPAEDLLSLPLDLLSNTTATLLKEEPTYKWRNWAGNQHANPARIFHPRSIKDLYSIVQKAKKDNKQIRCGGAGHSWSSTSVVNENGFLVDISDMGKIYKPVHVEDNNWTVEIETGVLILDLDNYLMDHDPPLTLPSNVVLDSIRYGGVISLGCHGAATHTRTISDLVTEVKIIDANGVLHSFSKDKDPIEFSAATVNLGLLGPIYSYTIRVETMFKLLMTDTNPPLKDYFSDPVVSGPKLKTMVLGNDQTELFYWPFNSPGLSPEGDSIWIKQWQRTDLPVTETALSHGLKSFLEPLETSFGYTLYEYMAANPMSTPFVNYLIHSALVHQGQQVLYAPHGIHYQAGIDNLPCLDLEMAFKTDDNFENVVKAWTYVIDLIYEYARRGEFPLNLALEMRFVKASTLVMSSAYDEDPDAIYCMIEVLSVVNTKGFEEFSAKVAQYWMENFQARPHWAKMWEHVPGIVPYLRSGNGNRYDQFEAVRKKYDPNGMFLTSTFAGVLGHSTDKEKGQTQGKAKR